MLQGPCFVVAPAEAGTVLTGIGEEIILETVQEKDVNTLVPQLLLAAHTEPQTEVSLRRSQPNTVYWSTNSSTEHSSLRGLPSTERPRPESHVG